MLWPLRILFLLVLTSMLAVTSWAGLQCPLRAIPPNVLHHPWFIATLADAYWGFITFFVWVAWKERSFAARLLWLVAILLLGNLAMASYMLLELFRVPAVNTVHELLVKRNPGRVIVPILLSAAGIFVYWKG